MNPDEIGQDIDRLEDRLRRLPLHSPPATLDARIARIGSPVAGRGLRRRLAGLTLAAAAVAASLAVMIAGGLRHQEPDGPPPAVARNGPTVQDPVGSQQQPPDLPVRIEQVCSTLSAGEIVTREGAPPMQRLSRQVVRRVQVIDDSRHVRIEWSIPSRESVLMPLEYN